VAAFYVASVLASLSARPGFRIGKGPPRRRPTGASTAAMVEGSFSGRCGRRRNRRRPTMSEKIKSEAISRRKALSILGLIGALGLAASTALTESEADAQEATPAPATSTGGTAGMKRRHGRRAGRHERRHERRTGQPAATAPAGTAQPQ